MASKKKTPETGACKGLTERQKCFALELARLGGVGGNATEAARRAGFQHPSVAACKLLKNYPLVVAEVERLHKELYSKTAEDVERYVYVTMFFEPLKYFSPGGEGTWVIDEEGLRNLPPEIGRLIETVDLREVEAEDGSKVRKCFVKLVSKTKAMELAAKAALGEKVNVNANVVNWNWQDLVYRKGQGGEKPDVLEERIKVLSTPAEEHRNGKEKRNGNGR